MRSVASWSQKRKNRYHVQGCAPRAAIRPLRSLKEAGIAKGKTDERAEDIHDLVKWATFKCQELSGGEKPKKCPGPSLDVSFCAEAFSYWCGFVITIRHYSVN